VLLDEDLDIHKFQNCSRNKRLVAEREGIEAQASRKGFPGHVAPTVILSEGIVRVDEAALRQEKVHFESRKRRTCRNECGLVLGD